MPMVDSYVAARAVAWVVASSQLLLDGSRCVADFDERADRDSDSTRARLHIVMSLCQHRHISHVMSASRRDLAAIAA
jgi:hypothetical protein